MTGVSLSFAIIRALAEIFALMVVGGIARRMRYLDDRDIDRFSRLVLDFLFRHSFFHPSPPGFAAGGIGDSGRCHYRVRPGRRGGWVLGIGLKYGLRTKNGNVTRTFLYFCIVNNYVFLPVVIVQNLWGAAMLANLFFLTLGSTLANWTIGIGVLGSTSESRSCAT